MEDKFVKLYKISIDETPDDMGGYELSYAERSSFKGFVVPKNKTQDTKGQNKSNEVIEYLVYCDKSEELKQGDIIKDDKGRYIQLTTTEYTMPSFISFDWKYYKGKKYNKENSQ